MKSVVYLYVSATAAEVDAIGTQFVLTTWG